MHLEFCSSTISPLYFFRGVELTLGGSNEHTCPARWILLGFATLLKSTLVVACGLSESNLQPISSVQFSNHQDRTGATTGATTKVNGSVSRDTAEVRCHREGAWETPLTPHDQCTPLIFNIQQLFCLESSQNNR